MSAVCINRFIPKVHVETKLAVIANAGWFSYGGYHHQSYNSCEVFVVTGYVISNNA